MDKKRVELIMDFDDIIKKISNIFTSSEPEAETILSNPGFIDSSNHEFLGKYLIKPDAFARYFPANDDFRTVINDHYAYQDNVSFENDELSDIYLSAYDIESIGGKLIINKDQAKSVNFEDSGWMKVKNDDIKFIDEELDDINYDTYIHETGAVVQITPGVETNFW